MLSASCAVIFTSEKVEDKAANIGPFGGIQFDRHDRFVHFYVILPLKASL